MERRDDLRWPARAATAIAVVLIALSVSFLAWRAAAPSQCASCTRRPINGPTPACCRT